MFGRNRYYSNGEKAPSFGLFIVPIAVFVVFGFPLITRYPVLVAIPLISFCIAFVLILLCCLYVGVKIDSYVLKHDFQLWKRSKSYSLKERREAGKVIDAITMQTPYLEKYVRYANKLAFISLTIWTIIFLICFSFIIFSAL
jgi:hypothetical protein